MVLRPFVLMLALAPASPSTTYLEQARFEEAAAAIEALPPTTPEALEQLRLAATIRIGLGQPALADADLAVIERAQPSREAAAATFWDRRPLLQTDAERLEHATTYLRQHARFGGREREALAELTIAELLSGSVCPRGSLLHGCVVVEPYWYSFSDPYDGRRPLRPRTAGDRLPAIRARCQPSRPASFPFPAAQRFPGLSISWRLSFPVLQPTLWHGRASESATRIQVHLQRARRRMRDLIPRPAIPLSAEYTSATWIAELATLEPTFEEFLRRRPPAIRVAPDRWYIQPPDSPEYRRTLRRQLAQIDRESHELSKFLERFDREAAALRAHYTELAARASSGTVARAAWLRAALVTHHQTVALTLWEPEGGFASRDLANAHCAQVRARNEPLEVVMRDAYERCFADARRTGHMDRSAEDCAYVLSELWPEDHPPIDELLDRPSHIASDPITIGIQLTAPSPDHRSR